MIKRLFKQLGPGTLVAAAFIGPGTVTVCTLAGVTHGFALLWALTLSVIATIVLQEMSARLGIIAQKGLAEVLKTHIKQPVIKVFVLVLILSAIVIGNTAYEAGNISGAVLGLETAFHNAIYNIGGLSVNTFALLIGILAFIVLYLGNYKVLERVMISLVAIMSIAFLTTALLTKPNLSNLLKGMFVPNFSKDSVLTVIALIGTTVVPYNLFLHAALVKEKWSKISDLKFAKRDACLAIILGGIVSMSIVISAAAIETKNIANAADLALGLQPLFGNFSKYVLAIGLFAAGITSAITAPLAAAYVTAGCLGWAEGLKSRKFRLVWMAVLLLGVISASLGLKAIEIIKFAQVANGILLPIIVVFLLWVMNQNSLLANYRNSKFQNFIGVIIVLIMGLLSLASFDKVFGLNLF